MQKIATPQDFQAELQRILILCQGPERPSRQVLASELNSLANRVSRVQGIEGRTITGPDVRLIIGEGSRYDMSIVVQQLPSKPLKRKLKRLTYNGYRFSTQSWYPTFRGESGGYLSMTSPSWLFGAEEMAKRAGFGTSTTFDKAAAGLKKALAAGVKTLEAEYKKTFPKAYVIKNPGTMEATPVPAEQKDLDRAFEWLNDGEQWTISEDEVYYLDIEPHDYKPIKFKGRDFAGTSEWREFKFYAERDEDEYMRQMEGMSAFYTSKSPGGARKLFKLLKGDPTLTQSMTVDKFTGWLSKNKIAYDYTPTVWR